MESISHSNTGYFTWIMSNIYNMIYSVTWPISIFNNKSHVKILCTGKWRSHETRRKELQYLIRNPVTLLSQEEEGELQAKCAHSLMLRQGLLSSLSEGEDFCLYLGAGRGSTQFTILNVDGDVIDVFLIKSGYPKNGSPDINMLRSISDIIYNEYGDSIKFILGFDAIFHVLKDNSPVVTDKGKLPEIVTTTGRHFLDLQYLTDLYASTPMMVVRNFVMSNGAMRKIGFATGNDMIIDLGSGNATLIYPITGNQLDSFDLPHDWTTNDYNFVKVAGGIEKLVKRAKRCYGDS